MSENRKLAAILAADVVGYSRLASADEDRTLARLRALRSDLIDPTIAVHNGRVIKRTGDGALVEFRSVVDAVRCAIEVQSGMVERNAGVPQDRRIEFRIGIHLGDVVEESDGDLMGDGVNIASRLEGVAAPGAICLSEDAYRQVKARLDLSVSDLGNTQLKNIADPIRVYSLQVGTAGAKATATSEFRDAPVASRAPPTKLVDRRPAIRQHERRRRAGVFRRRDLRRHHHGAVEAVAALRHRPQFVLHFQGQERQRSGGRPKLGVRYVLEGSVRKSGNRVRITAQLIDATTGGHLWAERFDRDLTDIFAVQDDVTQHIVGALALNLTEVDRQRLATEQTDNLEAYDCFLRGREHLWRFTREQNSQGSGTVTTRNRTGPEIRFRLRFPRHGARAGLHKPMEHAPVDISGTRGRACDTCSGARRSKSLRALGAGHSQSAFASARHGHPRSRAFDRPRTEILLRGTKASAIRCTIPGGPRRRLRVSIGQWP